MQKKIIIAITVLVLIGIGVFVYLYFFANTAGVAVAPAGSVSLPVAGKGTTGAETGSGSLATANAPVPVTARLIKISSGPVVPGEVVINIPAVNASSSPETAINYIERQSGNVFTYKAQAGTITRTNNKTIPGIQSAAWLPDASLAFVRYLSGDDFSTINTYALKANGSGAMPTGGQGFFLPQNLADIAVSSTSILTLASGVNGSVASVGRTDGTNQSNIFTTPLSALRVSFAGKNQYLAYTRPSSTLPGYAFLVNSSGQFSRIAGPLSGLVALAGHSGKWVLASFVSNGAMKMEIINTATNETVALPVTTIADKCVWTADDLTIYCGIPVSPPGNYSYPDDWYQGAVFFSDRIWKIDVASRYAQLVLDFSKETTGSLDAKALAVDPLNTKLVFMNKIDGSLWIYSL